jgi:hypothetical protein
LYYSIYDFTALTSCIARCEYQVTPVLACDLLPFWACDFSRRSGFVIEKRLFEVILPSVPINSHYIDTEVPWGLHLRQTDFPRASRVYRHTVLWFILLRTLSSRRAIVFSDSDEALSLFGQRFPSVEIRRGRKPEYEDGVLVRHGDSMLSALRDLVELAHCEVVPNSYSTFLDLAVRIRGALGLSEFRPFLFKVFDFVRQRYYTRIERKRVLDLSRQLIDWDT